MPRTDGYVNRRPTKDGERSPKLYRENAELATILCRIRGENLTTYVNRIVAEDMDEKFGALKMNPDNQLYL